MDPEINWQEMYQQVADELAQAQHIIRILNTRVKELNTQDAEESEDVEIVEEDDQTLN